MNVRRLFLPLLALTAIACKYEDPDEKVEPVPLEQVPAKIMEIVRAKFPDVEYESAYKGMIRGKEGFEVRGKTKSGKIREIEIAADGTIIATE